MADAYLITTVPDYEGFSLVEVHLDATAAQARVDAANDYAELAPAFTDDDASEDEVAAFIAAEQAWRNAHPFGPEVACGYLEERYRVIPVPTCSGTEQWRPMDTAPTDGTMVRLLIDYSGEDGFGPMEDALIAQTIGGNTDGNTGDDAGWRFAGWDWQQDCFTEGRGKPLGWLPVTPVPYGVKASDPQP